jgi:hypothetical protein
MNRLARRAERSCASRRMPRRSTARPSVSRAARRGKTTLASTSGSRPPDRGQRDLGHEVCRRETAGTGGGAQLQSALRRLRAIVEMSAVLVTLTEDHEAILRCVRSDDFSLAAGSAGDSTRSRRLASSNVRRTSMRRRRSPLVTTTPVAIKTPMMTGAIRRMTYRPMSTSCGPSSGVSRLARRHGERTLLLMRSQRNLAPAVTARNASGQARSQPFATTSYLAGGTRHCA